MEFRVLGPVEFWSAGQRHDLGPARVRCVLAMLLLTPRTIVPAETLIDRLWDARPPPKARESLSVYVARLRRSLRLATGGGVPLAGRAGGYLLDIKAGLVDLHQFRQLRRHAAALADGGDRGQAAAALREADRLWRGPALAGLGGDWIGRLRHSLEEERRAAIADRAGHELALGRAAGLVAELGELLVQYPLDETLVAHQMTALYRSGRPGDALALYRDTRRRLIDEQGAEPGPELAQLQQRILGHDPGLAGPAAGPRTWPGTLPPAAGFAGRAAELREITGGPGGRGRVTVIEGMPGVGKTALAVHAARLLAARYPDGALYLDLRSHDPARPALGPAEALHQLLRMSGPGARIPDALGERVTLWRARLRQRRAIVILDDAAGHDQVRPLLPTAGPSLMLITTRRRLPGLGDGKPVRLGPLADGDTVALLRQIAGEDRISDLASAAEIARLCGGLPLAIRHAALRLGRDPGLSLAGLVRELTPGRLGGTGTAVPDVLAAIDPSYRALGADQQRFFRVLGGSPCAGVSAHAAAAQGGCTLVEAEKALGILADHHLLDGPRDGQYQFHPLIRGYAAARAAREDPAADQRQAAGRLLDYYLYTADRADRLLHPFRRRRPVPVTQPPAAVPPLGSRADAAGFLEAEWRNILQAAQHAGRHERKRQCADLIHVLAEFVAVEAHWPEAAAAHAMALQACRDLADQAAVAQAALELSVVSQQAGQHAEALPLAEEAAAAFRSLGELQGEAEAIDQMGMAHQRAGRPDEALAHFREAADRFGGAADPRGEAGALSHAGIACWHLARREQALEHLVRALERYQQVGDRRGQAKALNNLGKIQLYRGYHRDALECYQQSLSIFEQIGGAHSQAVLHHNIGTVLHYKGSYEQGLESCQRALDIYRLIGDRPDEADVLNDIGAIYQSAACYDDALARYRSALQIAEEIGDLGQQLIALRRTGDAYRESGQYRASLDQYQAALALARDAGESYEEGKLLEGAAQARLGLRQPEAARIELRRALDIFERLGVPEAAAAQIRIDSIEPAPGLRAG